MRFHKLHPVKYLCRWYHIIKYLYKLYCVMFNYIPQYIYNELYMLHACILCTALRIMLLHRVQIVYPPFHPYSVLCPGNLAWGAERGMGSLFPHQGQGEVQHSEGVRRLAELIFWWSGIGAHGNIFVFFPGTSWDHFLWSNILAFEKNKSILQQTM